jgi:hypothetical protein
MTAAGPAASTVLSPVPDPTRYLCLRWTKSPRALYLGISIQCQTEHEKTGRIQRTASVKYWGVVREFINP